MSLFHRRSVALYRVVAALLAGAGLAGCKPKPVVAAPAAPADVVVTPVLQRDEPIRAQWGASIHGLGNAQIRAQVPGYLQRQVYADGTRVKKGDVLFEIDRRPFQAALEQVQATYDQAESLRKRQAKLGEQNAISAEEQDNAIHAAAAA